MLSFSRLHFAKKMAEAWKVKYLLVVVVVVGAAAAAATESHRILHALHLTMLVLELTHVSPLGVAFVKHQHYQLALQAAPLR